MGRQVRMVPRGWEHPKDDKGNYIPLRKGPYAKAGEEWDEGWAHWQRGEIEDYSAGDGEKKWGPKSESALECARYTDWAGSRPSPDGYMPEFAPGTATMLVMYEDTSEGTPISPPAETPEQLARWLTDNGASAFGGMKATYEQWLSTCKSGWAPSMVISGRTAVSGVEFLGNG